METHPQAPGTAASSTLKELIENRRIIHREYSENESTAAEFRPSFQKHYADANATVPSMSYECHDRIG
jgi:hypothetical protein